MTRRLALVAVFVVFGTTAGAQDPLQALRTGDYATAIRELRAVPASDDGWLAAQTHLARALALTGRYDDAERVARAAVAAPGGVAAAATLGAVLLERGRVAAADSAFTRALAGPDSLTAALELAVLAFDRGARDSAFAQFDRFIDVYNAGQSNLSSADFAAVAAAVTWLGIRDPQLFKDALRAYDRAIGADPDNLDARVALAELFLAKYNFSEAQSTLADVLRVNPSHPRALVAEARRRDADNQPGADSLVARALEVNAEYVPARVFAAELALGMERLDDARREAERALRTNPLSREARAVLAAAAFVAGDQAAYEAERARALAAFPRDAGFAIAMADVAGRNRRYQVAADLAREAIAIDSTAWRAHALLGMNLLRLGRIAPGRASLDVAFKGDPYDVWTKNTLDLLDTFKDYDVTTTEHFEVMIQKAESGILGVYLGDLAEEAWRTFAARYGYTPTPPVRMEIYRNHADFSVRTIGLAGLGALGVSFGNTLAFDSPAARDVGPFNWGATVWHELAHTFTLGATDNRVPRWLSEGLSVYEEHRARPGWGFQPSPGFLLAIHRNRLAPVSRLNDGFMRPAYPEQIQYSYLQAAYVAEMIAQRHGEGTLAEMLRAYRAGQSTEQVFQAVLKTTPRDIDRDFDQWLRQRLARPLAAVRPDSAQVDPSMASEELLQRAAARADSWITQMTAARILGDRGDTLARVPLERARALFPEYVGADGPYAALVALAADRKDEAETIALLTQVVRQGDANYGAHIALADLLELRGDTAGAAEALDRAMYINPFDIPVHARLAALFEATGNRQKVIRERRAIVALGPVDRAEALYRLAVAYDAAGDARQARRTVVQALEEAPNYVDAQELLLRLHGGTP